MSDALRSDWVRRAPAASGVELRIAPARKGSLAANLGPLSTIAPLRPFSDAAVRFLGDLTSAILTDPAMREAPELMAMAHSLRPARVLEFRREFERRNEGRLRRGVGLAFHLPPANVYTMIGYTWLLSLLAGNANVVRLSQRGGAGAERLLRVIAAILDRAEHEEIRARTLFVSYGHDDEVTATISRCVRARVIWGGDQTVASVRSIPLAEGARELAFGDRFSWAALDARAVATMGHDELTRLAHAFANDALWFDQQACSSPRAVCWVGAGEEVQPAATRFWEQVRLRAREIGWSLAPAEMMARMTTIQEWVARDIADGVEGSLSGQALVRVALPEAAEVPRTEHSGRGVFFELSCRSLPEIDRWTSTRDQTLALAGFRREEVEDWARRRTAPGFDRVVEIGSALAFDPVWDGVDLFDELTDECIVRL